MMNLLWCFYTKEKSFKEGRMRLLHSDQFSPWKKWMRRSQSKSISKINLKSKKEKCKVGNFPIYSVANLRHWIALWQVTIFRSLFSSSFTTLLENFGVVDWMVGDFYWRLSWKEWYWELSNEGGKIKNNTKLNKTKCKYLKIEY